MSVPLLSSCGGGGTSSTQPNYSPQPAAVVSSLAFPLSDGMRFASEYSTSTNYTISGHCNGTATFSNLDAVPSSFENAPSIAVSSTETFYFSNCTPTTLSSSGISHFDSNFIPLGSIQDNGQYGVYPTQPVIPLSVHVGDSGRISRKQLYTDITKSVSLGHSDLSYIVEADTADSAIVDLINRIYLATNLLEQISHNRYRITASGAMFPVSIDIQAPSVSLHLAAQPDTQPPNLIQTSPRTGIAGPATPISMEFNERLDCTYVPVDAISIVASTGATIPGTLNCRGRTITFTPDTPLTHGETYSGFLVSNGVRDLSGNISSGNATLNFRWDSVAPSVISTSPAALAVDVALSSQISITLSEAILPLASGAASLTVSSAAGVISGTETFNNNTNTLSFRPAAPLQPGTTYTITLSGQVTDNFLNPIGADYSWSFTTDPTFNSRVNVPYDGWLSAVAIGDVNGDGKADLVVATESSQIAANAYRLLVFLQNAGGGLNSPVSYATNASFNAHISDIKIGDVNNDGRNDIVTSRVFGGMEIYLQNIAGTLDPAVQHSSMPSALDLADLNNDGLLDVVQYSGIDVMLQNTNGTLGAPAVYPPPQFTSWLNGNLGDHGGGIGDLNADGLPDIAAKAGIGFCVLLQSGAGAFSLPTCYTTPAVDLAVGDLNGDSLADVAVVYGGNRPGPRLGVFHQNAGVLDPVVSYASYDIPSQVEIADMTGDGLMDVLVLHDAFNRLGIYRQLANGGGLQREILYQQPSCSVGCKMAVGDINSDGKPDVVVIGSYININNLTINYHY